MKQPKKLQGEDHRNLCVMETVLGSVHGGRIRAKARRKAKHLGTKVLRAALKREMRGLR